MSKKIKGIVLKQTDYRENDIIIKVLSKENGIVSFVVRGAKKSSSKNNVACRQLCLSEFIYNESKNSELHNLMTATLIKSYLAETLEDISIQSVFTEILDKNYNNEEVDSVFELLKFTLDNLNYNKYLTASLFIARMLDIQGFGPYVDGCVLCNKPNVVSVSPASGGFLCVDCNEGKVFTDKERLKKFRLINKALPENYYKIKDIEYDFNDFKIIMDFYIYQLNQKIYAYELLTNIN